MKKSILKEYAKLLITKGINVQKGQDVIIYASLDQPEFVKMCVEEAYRAKARYVKVEFSDPSINKIVSNKTPLSYLNEFSDVSKAKWEYRKDVKPCLLYLESDDPDALKGLNQEKASKNRAHLFKYIKPYREAIENKYQWCIAGVPGVKWAKKMFPELSKKQALEKLWESILYVSKVDENPSLAWDNHNEQLRQRCKFLNDLNIDYLHYTASNGTDFKVWMLENALWMGGEEINFENNIYYNPNIPSEEVFTSPLKGKAEGIVYSSKPLSYNGEVIDEFFIEFKEGKAVRWDAKKNKELLGHMLTIDETACYLGECALISYDSPISNTNLLFYNTLYDENASCHLAIGHGFTNCIKNYENYTQQELYDMGINDSLTHVDFMIGTKDLKIVAHTRDHKEVTIFENGNFVR